MPIYHTIATGEQLLLDEDTAAKIAGQRWSMDGNGVIGRSYREDGRPRRVTLNQLVGGPLSGGQVWTHRDGDPYNFTRDNLEAISRSALALRTTAARRPPAPRTERKTSTQRRTAKRKPGEYVGVIKEGNKWRAQISEGGKMRRLGAWPDKEEAARAYDDAVAALGKPRVNFPTAEDLAADAREQAEIDALPRPHSRAMRELREKKRAS